ncbi:outer membrane protein assembly factor BamD [Pontimicrobium aquaticum]|uniref:Outer membrane protein assembly factor BamD n=1 Tax=Pontimicrobium aquaticum TaxID=2565367 RepID=A0A4U0F0B1_9FLAO|nr:outer membrane protein assembly factor BamD [Pontimicrobium aquaticum]TJY36082.1 outer membrane protein assembly factor BamD [Pontimicrobium aquaticum]
MKQLIYIFIIAIAFSSCSEFQKAIKSEDIAVKFKMGTDLYESGKYRKALRLFDQIVPKYRGKPQAQKLMYMNAKAHYEVGDYYTSNYHMERFVNSYPESEKAEEMAFLAAKSYYHLPPVYSKEQKETVEAIEKIQSFINAYPNSEFLAEANKMVKELDFKLERKAYEIAKQYHTLGPHNRDYEAAIKAFDNFILDFPGATHKEKAMFYRLDSAYKLAVNSVESKKEERVRNAIEYYDSFKSRFAESEFLEEANKMNAELIELQRQYENKG